MNEANTLADIIGQDETKKPPTIAPTVGRVVWVRNRYGNTSGGQPEAALITYVWNDRLINVGGFDANGQPFAVTSLPLAHEIDGHESGLYAEWMPYQKGQAAKTEKLEAAVGKGA
jgi:hypothetical protein